MTRTVFAMAVAAVLIFAVSNGSQAASIAPLSGVLTADQQCHAGLLVSSWLVSPSPALLARPLGPRALPRVVVGC